MTISLPSICSLFALLIGINTYNGGQKSASGTEANVTVKHSTSNSSTILDLRGAVPDAENFEKYLLNTLRVDKDNISVLLDERATRKNIIDAFQDLANNKKIKKNDSIFIFYAGHGAQALPPNRMAGLPGRPEHVELLVPYGFVEGSTEYQHMGIPDYTLAALLDKISKEKGNNIVCRT